MAADFGVNLSDHGNLAEVSAKVAATLDVIAKREKAINDVAKATGKSYKDAAKGVAMLDAQERKRQGQSQRDEAKRYADGKREEMERKKLLRDFKNAAFVVSGAVAATTALGIAIAVVAAEAGKARAGATALAGAWTGGDGPRTLKVLDKLAQSLGEKFSTVRDEFIEFRRAGLDNSMAARLIKLRADLVAVGLSAEQADKEIAPVLSAKGDKQRLSYMQQISKAFHVAGDGALAASTAGSRFEAGLNRLDNVKTKAFEQIWTRIEPAIGKATNEVARFLGQFLASAEGQRTIESLGVAFELVAGSVVKATRWIAENGETLGNVLSTSFGIASSVIAGIMHPIDSAAESFGMLGRSIMAINKSIDDTVYGAVDAIIAFVPKMFRAGEDLIGGLVDGIASKAKSAIAAVGELASGVSDTFKGALGIQSPSKVFAGYGENVVRGFEQGQQRALPVDMPIQRAASAAPVGGSGGDAGGGVSINISVYAQPGQDVGEWVEEIRRQVQRVLTSGALSRGFV